ncbi:DeoR/GlpR family DNA-binding transcription regulator [Rudaeicoccus suwonensis]|uniref:DeoR family transcriptional regulator n=1 Tax=Rudaeicoccus suwonensis TaxID=657409 RepID=A0A561E9A0_9MICO|nr:DeoR/GlpR family DNA-binding transcription regulator [Rudaeicoccus suwonensis]TWE12208.1 DeoR family transcriptional regulator [Rudaeicoccus suwonensis]
MTDTADRSPRWAMLMQLLAERGRLSVVEVCEQLDVSPATVRRDFNELAAQQLATRVHGGVVATAVAYELPARYRSAGKDAAKQQIAERASVLVEPGMVVGFNGGTTTTAVARAVAARPDLADHRQQPALTAVTNALNIAVELVLRPVVRTVGLGGVARPESYEQTGPITENAVDQMWFDLLILGVDGFDAATGATCRHPEEASINARMVARAERVVVVATAEKIGRATFSRICTAERVQTLVTDAAAEHPAVVALSEAGVDVASVIASSAD